MDVRTKIAKIVFEAQNHINMFSGESLHFYSSTVERDHAYRAADTLIEAGLIKTDLEG